MSSTSYLTDIINASAVKLPEKLFKAKYLPLLFYKDPYIFNITWITEVSGSPHVRVYIIDDKDPDTVLFSIPPLREELMHSNDPNLMASLSLIKTRMNIDGVGGYIALSNQLPHLIGVKAADNKVFEAEWKAILDRYGLSFFYKEDIKDEDSLSIDSLQMDMLDDW